MEDCLVAAQRGTARIGRREIDLLLRGIDLLSQISRTAESDIFSWTQSHAGEVESYVTSMSAAQAQPAPSAPPKSDSPRKPAVEPDIVDATPVGLPADHADKGERVLRLSAENLNRLLGLAGESLVEARWIRPFTDSIGRLKRMQNDLSDVLSDLRDELSAQGMPPRAEEKLESAVHRVTECRSFLGDRLLDLDTFDRRCVQLTHRLYLEALRTRMRPFADGVRRFPRMVRDISRSLGKEVRLEITGENTPVDRDILDRLESPLAQLLRNAIDHGCELPDAREAAGKPKESALKIEARHAAGMLLITVSDDGAGIDPEQIRQVVAKRQLLPTGMSQRLTEGELLQFLFLPGFTMKDQVTELSGRGVGLDVVHNMVRGLRGNVRVNSQPGSGTRFVLQLPITLSVLRTLLVEIAGEPYALPLAQIVRSVRLKRDDIEAVESQLSFRLNDEAVGLLPAQQILDGGEVASLPSELAIVVLGERNSRYGLIVDKFLGERELVVQPLDSRLGKVKDISAAALMEDGSPVLIIDVDDMLRSIEKLIASGRLGPVRCEALLADARPTKRVLVIDDSLTVRELERKLLLGHGYAVEVAVDGMDGWNALRAGTFDLILTDVDMPRLDGIELTEMVKKDPQYRNLPVMIVSYKDREEDRLRGLEAGADYYLTKASFHDETLLNAVADLIGEAEE